MSFFSRLSVVSRGYRNLSHYFGNRLVFRNDFKCINYAIKFTYSTNAEPADSELHTIINDNECSRGSLDKIGFQAETQKLLNIVARSLYSDKEVFVRELISNASDAIERLRFYLASNQLMESTHHTSMQIHIKTDEAKKLLIIQDMGIGMTKDEMKNNLGIIACSGSQEFVNKLNENKNDSMSTDIIGQFGVGFYSSFMVSDKVEVFSRSFLNTDADACGYYWSSTGLDGQFELGEAENVNPGTKIILHLKDSCSEFAQESAVERILQKYSNFVSTPIFLNGRRVNVLEPIWIKQPQDVTDEEHTAFYQYLSGSTYDTPRYKYMYKTDAPLNLRVLLYVPNWKPSIFDLARETNTGVALYSRKVMIMNRTDVILPKWLRFMKGVVDSEDVPLNLSRELLQDSSLIRRINRLLTARVIRFLSQQASRDKDKFKEFLQDYGLYLKEGIALEHEQEVREEIAKLLRWESSALPPNETTSLEEYSSRMRAGERNIYFMSTPNRKLAETSANYEALRKKSPDTEVLFLYEAYDELVLMQLNQFDKKNLTSVETLLADDLANTDSVGPERPNCLTQDEATSLINWAQGVLGDKVKQVKVTQRLESHPCFVSIREAGAMRHFLRTTLADRPAEEKFRVMQPILELNPEHRLIRYLSTLTSTDQQSNLAKSILHYLYDVALTEIGLLEDVREMVLRSTDLISQLVPDGCEQSGGDDDLSSTQ